MNPLNTTHFDHAAANFQGALKCLDLAWDATTRARRTKRAAEARALARRLTEEADAAMNRCEEALRHATESGAPMVHPTTPRLIRHAETCLQQARQALKQARENGGEFHTPEPVFVAIDQLRTLVQNALAQTTKLIETLE